MDSIKQAGYKFHKWLNSGQAVFENLETGELEIWFANKNHHGYGITWRGHDWKFARGYDSSLGQYS